MKEFFNRKVYTRVCHVMSRTRVISHLRSRVISHLRCVSCLISDHTHAHRTGHLQSSTVQPHLTTTNTHSITVTNTPTLGHTHTLLVHV